jgi:hypothetical protein
MIMGHGHPTMRIVAFCTERFFCQGRRWSIKFASVHASTPAPYFILKKRIHSQTCASLLVVHFHTKIAPQLLSGSVYW